MATRSATPAPAFRTDRVARARRAARVDGRPRVAVAARLGDDQADVDDVEHHAMRTRRAFLASVSVASALATRPGASFAESVAVDASDALGAQLASARATRVSSAAASSSLATGSSARAMRIPMRLDRAGTYVVEYRIGGTTVRGVLDTGSPFITMESACGQVWGCLREEDARRSGLEDTYEVYGLQEDGVTRWVLGDVTFAGKEATKDETNETATSDARQRLGSFVGDASNDSNDGNLDAVSAADAAADAASVVSFAFPELSFGVTSQTTGRAGSAAGGVGSAPFVGLVKQRADWIRPTFLEQTDVASFALDFEKDELLLSRDDLIPRGVSRNVFPLVDLRPMGAPVFHYAGEGRGAVDQRRAVPRAGCAAETHIRGVRLGRHGSARLARVVLRLRTFEFGTFECHARIRGEDGARVSVGTSLRTCTGRCLFLALPVEVPWVGFEDAHVIFLGLAFMYGQGGITVDADAKRLALGAFGPT
jgi:hypothetical protein